MLDFTLKTYRSLLEAFRTAGYSFFTFEEYCDGARAERMVVLRHDVDEMAGNALKLAKLEHELGIKATYFFRVVKQSNDPSVITQIAALGHEIGYHYEDLATCEGDYENAIASFQKNLSYFRTYYPVRTVCMHGSSSSIYDNRLLWERYNLEDYGIVGEPYLSLKKDMFYLTDTGFAWDGGKYAIRDLVANSVDMSFHSTSDVIKSVKSGTYPKRTMILAHTGWTDSSLQWLFLQCREFARNRVKLLSMKHPLVHKLYSRVVKWYWK